MLERYELTHGDLDRYVLYDVPSTPAPGGGWPLVLALHGGGSTPLDMARFCRIVDVARQRGFAILLPAGSGPHPDFLTWNAGRCCGHAARRETDDVGFLSQVLDTAIDELPINTSRIYATGISNGGMMSYRLASELPGRIAAIAPVAGSLVCDPPPLERLVPVLHFHGTRDEFVPYPGGRGPRSLRRVDFPSVEDSLTRWCQACGVKVDTDAAAAAYQLLDTQRHPAPIANDQSLSAHRRVLAHSNGTPAVIEVRIDGGGHTWPGVAPPLAFMGPTLLGLLASEMIFDFFDRFTLDQ